MTMQSLDTELLLFFNRGIANSWFDILMPAFSYQGYLLVAPFLIYMIIQGSTRENAEGQRHLLIAVSAIAIAGGAVYLSGLAEDVLKVQIGRVRPCGVVEGLRLIIPCPTSYSIPSGHAISSFSFAVPLFYLTRKYLTRPWRLYPIILASMIAFSRLYLGVHYPTDVLAGVLLGTSIAMGLSWGYEQIIFPPHAVRNRTRNRHETDE